VKAFEQYLVLEFSFNLNQVSSGAETCGDGIPTSLFSALHLCWWYFSHDISVHKQLNTFFLL